MNSWIDRILESWVGKVLAIVIALGLIGYAIHSLQVGNIRIPLVEHYIRIRFYRDQTPGAFYFCVAAAFGIGIWTLITALRSLLDTEGEG